MENLIQQDGAAPAQRQLQDGPVKVLRVGQVICSLPSKDPAIYDQFLAWWKTQPRDS